MTEPFVGQLAAVAFNFPPRNWVSCEGQLLPIAQFDAMFSLLGTTFGGDGRTTFGVPDLRGRVAVGQGHGPGLTPRVLGAKGGAETVTLNANQIPAHTHSAEVKIKSSSTAGSTMTPVGNYPAAQSSTENYATTADSNSAALTSATIPNAGGNLAHSNLQPVLAVKWVIATQGQYPSRN